MDITEGTAEVKVKKVSRAQVDEAKEAVRKSVADLEVARTELIAPWKPILWCVGVMVVSVGLMFLGQVKQPADGNTTLQGIRIFAGNVLTGIAFSAFLVSIPILGNVLFVWLKKVNRLYSLEATIPKLKLAEEVARTAWLESRIAPVETLNDSNLEEETNAR